MAPCMLGTCTHTAQHAQISEISESGLIVDMFETAHLYIASASLGGTIVDMLSCLSKISGGTIVDIV